MNKFKNYYGIQSGIYYIRCVVTDIQYIGQSKRMSSRATAHHKELRENRHSNPKLQNAWNKYGADMFEFGIIETCDVSQLNEREQYYFDTLNKDTLFNIHLTVGEVPKWRNASVDRRLYLKQKSEEGLRRKEEYALLSDEEKKALKLQRRRTSRKWDGTYRKTQEGSANKARANRERLTGTHLSEERRKHMEEVTKERMKPCEFIHDSGETMKEDGVGIAARKYNLKRKKLGEVFTGVLPSYKGWRLLPGERERLWIEKGIQKEQGYGPKRLLAMSSASKETHRKIKEGISPYGPLINPSGEVVQPEMNLLQFARENDLHRSGLGHLYSGKYKTYKGWKLAE